MSSISCLYSGRMQNIHTHFSRGSSPCRGIRPPSVDGLLTDVNMPRPRLRPPSLGTRNSFTLCCKTIKVFGIQFMGNASLSSQTQFGQLKKTFLHCAVEFFFPHFCCTFLTYFLKKKRALIACLILKLSCSKGKKIGRGGGAGAGKVELGHTTCKYIHTL